MQSSVQHRAPEIVDRILAAMQQQEPIAVATVIAANADSPVPVGAKILVRFDGSIVGGFGEDAAAAWLTKTVTADAVRAIPEGRVTVVSYDLPAQQPGQPAAAVEVAIEAFLPPPTIVILGAGHIAVPVARIGKILGYGVVVIDDRPDFANRERFPEADQVLTMDFLEGIERVKVTPSTYFVLVTRGHKHDQTCLNKVILTDPAYIGMIGSKRRVRAVLRHLAKTGVPDERIARVHTPIGLDISAETPEEIAVAIVAEIIKVRRGGTARSLSEKG